MLKRIVIILLILAVWQVVASDGKELMRVNLKSLLLLTTIKGEVHAINSETGEEIWRTSLGESLLETHYAKATGMEEFLEQLNEKNGNYPFLLPLTDGNVVTFVPRRGFQV